MTKQKTSAKKSARSGAKNDIITRAGRVKYVVVVFLAVLVILGATFGMDLFL